MKSEKLTKNEKNSKITAPLSPSTARRLGYNRNLRTASVELPDEVEKSLSSASTSPCSSPGRQNLAVSSCCMLENFE